MKSYSGEEHVNIGFGTDFTIRELAEMVGRVVGIDTPLQFDTSKPDGPPQKLLDSRRIRGLGWRPRTGLEEGLRATYAWYLERVVQ
jgi:GDP-L-fucose synthase